MLVSKETFTKAAIVAITNNFRKNLSNTRIALLQQKISSSSLSSEVYLHTAHLKKTAADTRKNNTKPYNNEQGREF